jgi:predicted DNA-binding ribbon-helix-helix protein
MQDGGMTATANPFLVEGQPARVVRDLEVTILDRVTRLAAGERVTVKQLVPMPDGQRLARVELASGLRLTIPTRHLEAC